MARNNRTAPQIALRSGSTVSTPAAGSTSTGKVTASAIRFFPIQVILEAVAAEFGVTATWLCRPVNRKEWSSRVAIFLIMFDGEGAGSSRVADCFRIKAEAAGKEFVSQAEVVDRIYKAVKAELRADAQLIERIEKIRRALYGLSDPKAPLPLTIRGLVTPRDAEASATGRRVLPKVAPASTPAPQVGRHEPDDHEGDSDEGEVEPELAGQPEWPDEPDQDEDD